VQDLNGKSKDDLERLVVDLFGKDCTLSGVITLNELGLMEFPRNGTAKIVKRELEGLLPSF